MRYSLSVEFEAQLDYDDAIGYYDNISTDLGDNFYKTVNAAFELIKNNPNISFQNYKGLERFILKQFPFSIYFFKNNEEQIIKVLGILHFKRDVDAILPQRKPN